MYKCFYSLFSFLFKTRLIDGSVYLAGENLIDFTYTENTDNEKESFVNYFALIFSKAGSCFKLFNVYDIHTYSIIMIV